MCFAYILKSLKDGKHYYGSTKDITKRLKAHNSGKVKATKGRRPLVLHCKEKYENISQAYKRELFFKSVDGYRWLKDKKII